MLSDHPIKFNNTTIPFPKVWNEEHSTVENVYQTEAGTDQVSVTRYDKLTVSVETTCLASVTRIVTPFAKQDSFTLTKYSPETGQNETRTVRMRDLRCELQEKTSDLAVTDGIWRMSYTLEEF